MREVVPLERLQEVAELAASETPPSNGQHQRSEWSRLVLPKYLEHFNWSYRLKSKPTDDGRDVYLVTCPFNSDHGQHTDTSLMQHRSTGQPAFKCMHKSCVGKGWQDFKAAVGKPLAEHYDAPLRKSDPRVRNEPKPDGEPIRPQSIGEMISNYPKMRPVVIDGLLRQGETANVIASPKVGKSWLTYGLALSKVTGRPWFEQFECPRGRVLIIDNELHPETVTYRIPTVANALGIKLDEYHDQIDVVTLRGRLMDLFGLERIIENVATEVYDLIIGDAWYRFIPKGVSENDNADVMMLYNQLDKYMGMVKAAWAGVHHATKGSQGEKAITDVGAGAGAQARAADTHIILREHEQPGIFVLEAALRSFAPVEPLALQWEFPIWVPAEGVDTEKLKGRKNKAEERQDKRDTETDREIIKYTDTWRSRTELEIKTGFGVSRIKRGVARLLKDQKLDGKKDLRKGNECDVYRRTAKGLELL